MEIITTTSCKQTITLGKRFARKLQGGEILLFIGNLGSGKTQFIKGIGKGLGIFEEITSPTFNLMKFYVPREKRRVKKKLRLVHIDCYRISRAQEIEDIGALEYFGRDDSVVAIEWAEKIEPLIWKFCLHQKLNVIQISFFSKNKNTRIFRVLSNAKNAQ